MKLPDNVTLTKSQDTAVTEIIQWVNDKSDTAPKTWCLYGAPGTGKSFVTKIVIDNLPYSLNYVAVSAPTHKAKKVLSDFTGLKAVTIQALLGLRPDMSVEEFDINNIVFAEKAEPQIYSYKLIIIDECSMVNKSLFEYLFKCVQNTNIRILYVGDKCQLPPVNEVISPTFEDAGGTSTLMEPVRQSYDNPLTIILQALRAEIDGSDYQRELLHKAIEDYPQLAPVKMQARGFFKMIIKLMPTWINASGEGYHCTNDVEEFGNEVLRLFSGSEFKSNINFVKYITYTNDSVVTWNKYIRENVFDFKDELAVGDLLTCYTTLVLNGSQVLTNSEDYIVKYVLDDKVSYFIKRGGRDYQVTIPVWLVTIVLASKPNSYGETVSLVKPEGLGAFLEAHNYYLIGGRKFKRWKDYYAFKNQYMLLGNKLQTMVQSKKDVPTRDFDYAFAITAHKSQGSTYNTVLVNGINIRTAADTTRKTENFDPYIYALQLLYVAISRAKERAIIFI